MVVFFFTVDLGLGVDEVAVEDAQECPEAVFEETAEEERVEDLEEVFEEDPEEE